ncbi:MULTISPECIES: SDR family NAD(P)-dependent oxidoreductase [unclassified Mycolicibacterium]|uniref:SDR family NAD(P)-dependent oxidoreductase n=3 Tax=Mycolicibacterium TaxID=1866885 RepID=UPI0012DC85EF|nr:MULTISPECIES: SDR family NAD(P)-dependent oxidoreductase [unclassified Mycolicibacterium]MUL82201.1 SDR family oxidoreductase [Mycolicibacterium sp. CBMA 329]MUL87967.1 SDR family oxidoreductase [Mycolicibacterium sp. CBMA 331]MUM02298.1 SDR family oxidoreductase [Mycolicibacterium sp. CBMA 334]MUM38264.1 SDR family oxidoreductase [Mycolicibacterium sp. CBMA 247]MUM44032.1 SDR family oxidoreductase [Mycolicibacterium sp. CBMA 294]
MSTYSHPHSLDGHVAIVTGAARGVGKGIASALLSRGARVLVTDILDEVLADTTAEFAEAGFDVASVVADLRDADSAQHIVDAALDAFGTVDGLVNNAVASAGPIPFVDIPAEEYERVHDTGPRATFRLMQAIHPVMVKGGGGSIVNLGSAAGTVGTAAFGAYGSAKEAIRGMSKVAALEWGVDRIRVNVVCPLAETDGLKVLRDMAPKQYEQVVRSTSLKRIGDPTTDIGSVVAFLIGDDSTYLTGQTLLVDGGAGSFR